MTGRIIAWWNITTAVVSGLAYLKGDMGEIALAYCFSCMLGAGVILAVVKHEEENDTTRIQSIRQDRKTIA